MSVNEMQAHVKARVWRAIAQTNLDISALDKATLEALVDLVTEAALLEADEAMDKAITRQQPKAAAPATGDDEEKVLWEGRPFLSLTLHYLITSERVRVTEGLLGKAREDVELIRIQDIDFSQTFSERLINVGDVIIRSHDPSHPRVELKNVKDPSAVHEILRRAMLNARKRHNFAYREEM
jgi:hypothetical protein